MVDYTIHRFAEFLPLPDDRSPETLSLQDSLLANGMLTPVLLFQDKILDGRRRYFAHKKLPQIELLTEEFNGSEEEALERAIALNTDRRELNTSQRALLAWNYTREQRKVSVKEAKELAQTRFLVGKDSIELVGVIVSDKDNDQADKNILINAIGNGFPVNTAYKIMKTLPVIAWTKAVEDGDGTTARDMLKESRKQILEAKKELKATQARNEAIKSVNEAVANGGSASYQLLLIDHAELDSAMPVPAMDDCVVFIWSKLNQVAERIEIMEGWGFSFHYAYVWYKSTSHDAELLLQGIKGKLPEAKQPMPSAQGYNLKEGKPQGFKDAITKMFPDLTKFDMFGSGKNSEGWMHGASNTKRKTTK